MAKRSKAGARQTQLRTTAREKGAARAEAADRKAAARAEAADRRRVRAAERAAAQATAQAQRAARRAAGKSTRMAALEEAHGQPIEAILSGLMNEQPRLSWLEMAARLGVGERTFRSWRSQFGAQREVIWRMPGGDE